MSREDLARRAVVAWQKCGLVWLPAMSAWDPKSHLWKWRDGQAPADGIVRERYPDDPGYSEQWPGWLPDLDDHATLGCIEHGMLPAAWGPEVILTVRRWTTESGEVLADIHVHTLTGACAMLFGAVDVPLAEGLVLCLEAAAERRRP